ncbi:MAG TPA: hypothetical protein VMV43_11905 [Candidatus Nanopelagicaceae bacterium]|jgi:hypothetical protein|nr:hypothetical protein [Candidatus Nanopelagicaceae bacterium]
MSSKVVSYFDWSLGFKRNSADHTPKFESTKKSNLNSIGMSDDDFKTHLSKWKEKNLS